MNHLQTQLERILHLAPDMPCEVGTYAHADLTFGDLCGLGRATRLHVTVDLFGYAFDELAWWSTSKQDRTIFHNKQGIGTIYLGRYASKTANKFCIYDKAAEQRKKHAKEKTHCASIPDKWIRIEACINNPNIRVECLDQLSNQFTDLQCAHVANVFKQAGYPPLESWARESLALVGSGGGTWLSATLNPVLSHKLKAALDSAVPLCWNKKELWAGWPAALAKAVPSVFPSKEPALH